MRAAPDPRALTWVVWGLTSRPPVSPAGFLRFPVCPPGSPPSPAFPRFPFVRRSPVRSLRPLPGSGSPSVSLRIPFPLSSLYLTAAAGRFPGHWSRAAGTKVTSSAATTSPRIARSARTADGQRLSATGCHRIACYERPRVTGHRRARAAQIGGERAARGARIGCRSRSVRGDADACLSLSLRLSRACCSPGSRGGAARRYPCPLRRLAARAVGSTARLRPPGSESD